MPAPIRIRASAAIVRDAQILLIEYDDEHLGHHYNLPGGGLEPGETVRETAIREVREETTAEISLGGLLLTWEVFAPYPLVLGGSSHGLGFVFRGHLLDGSEPVMPPNPDQYQVAVHWLPLNELSAGPLLPQMADVLVAALNGHSQSGGLHTFEPYEPPTRA